MNDNFLPDHVVDVEFRWLERSELIRQSGVHDDLVLTQKIRVLQYRKLWSEADPVDVRVSDTKARRWSDWVDVPAQSE
jgi:hypothetical protein